MRRLSFVGLIINMFLLEAVIALCVNTQIEEQAWRGKKSQKTRA